MKKYLGVILIFALLFVIAFSSGMVAAAQQKTLLLEQEIALLRDHNGRLIKSLALSEARQADALTMAYNGKADKEQLVAAITEAGEWLWMAESALEELDRVVREGDPEADIPMPLIKMAPSVKYAPGKETIAGVLAYNRGPTGARKWLQSGKAPEDHQYVQRVMETYERLKGV